MTTRYFIIRLFIPVLSISRLAQHIGLISALCRLPLDFRGAYVLAKVLSQLLVIAAFISTFRYVPLLNMSSDARPLNGPRLK